MLVKYRVTCLLLRAMHLLVLSVFRCHHLCPHYTISLGSFASGKLLCILAYCLGAKPRFAEFMMPSYCASGLCATRLAARTLARLTRHNLVCDWLSDWSPCQVSSRRIGRIGAAGLSGMLVFRSTWYGMHWGWVWVLYIYIYIYICIHLYIHISVALTLGDCVFVFSFSFSIWSNVCFFYNINIYWDT